MALEALSRAPTNKSHLKNYSGAFLLSEGLFHQVLAIIIKAKSLNPMIDTLSAFLEKASKALYRLNLIEASEKIKSTAKSKPSGSQEQVQISLADIQQITTFIHKVNQNDKFTVRNNMLGALRHLLHHRGIFEFLKKEMNVYLRLMGFCRDGRNMSFNRNAWRVFFQIIFYHAGALDILEKTKVLPQFLDIIGANSGPVIMVNSLYYTYKLFAMLFREPIRQMQAKIPARGGDIKSLEKDIKMLSQFFVHAHLFIKIHMIYKRLIEKQPGSAFIQLSKLYHVIGTLPACKKLFKDIQRNPEYKDGLQKICNMFNYPVSSPVIAPDNFREHKQL